MIKITEKTEVALKTDILNYLKKNIVFEGAPSMIQSKQLTYTCDLYDIAVAHLTDNQDNIKLTNN